MNNVYNTNYIHNICKKFFSSTNIQTFYFASQSSSLKGNQITVVRTSASRRQEERLECFFLLMIIQISPRV